MAAVLVFVAATIPRHALRLAGFDDGTVAGLLHIHTNRSDGLGSPDEVAAAAARAGLKFIVFTDHGDATRMPDPPQYRSGVLCLDGVEISTSGGHYIAIDMPASPYPLAGEPRNVVEDVRRLGGFGIAAHPDSPKAQLRWMDWTAPIDGVELVNLDTSWRVLAAQPGFAGKRRLFSALIDYPFRSPEVVASLIQPSSIVAQWAAAAATRRVVTVAGADAHARLQLLNGDPQPRGAALSIPDYETAFRVISVHVRPERALTSDASTDARLIASALRQGRLYTAIDGVATPPSFSFSASNSKGAATAGDELAAGGGVTLHVQSNAPAGWTTIVHDGAATLSAAADTQDLTVHGPNHAGVYWAEIVSTTGTPPIAWIRSNPVYVRASVAAAPASATAPTLDPRAPRLSLFDGKSAGPWRVEHDANSVGAVDVARSPNNDAELRLRFGLAGGNAVGQFVAFVYDLPNSANAFNRMALDVRAERPMRLSLQLRDAAADRWQRSIYVDPDQQSRVVSLDDFVPVGVTHVAMPERAAIRAVMIVVDTTNTSPGISSRAWIRDIALIQ